MDKRHCWPEGHWNWPITVTHKHGVRCGEIIWVGGQVDLDSEGVVLNQGELAAQTANVMRNFATVLDGLDCDLQDLVWLLCFYVNDGSIDETKFLDMVADALPLGTQTTVNAVPVPSLAYEGMKVEIEGYAMRRENGDRTTREYAVNEGSSLPPPKFCQALRSGKMIFVSGQYPINADGQVLSPGHIVNQTSLEMNRIGRLLSQFGANFSDVVKSNRWYSGRVDAEDSEPAALACAAYYQEPGPAATAVPLPRHANDEVAIKLSCVAMLGEDGRHLAKRHVSLKSLWGGTLRLPNKHGLKCEEMVFFAGPASLDRQGVTLNPNDISAQTHQAMKHIGTILRELGADYDDVCKMGTYYRGDCGANALHSNLPIRSSYFSEPGPATTGIPVPKLAYGGMLIEIEGFAMVTPGLQEDE